MGEFTVRIIDYTFNVTPIDHFSYIISIETYIGKVVVPFVIGILYRIHNITLGIKWYSDDIQDGIAEILGIMIEEKYLY